MPDADSMLPPTLDIVVTRHDVLDEACFRGTGVLALFETLFPPNERDNPDDIVRWVMADDVGERRGFTLNGKEIDYRLDSRCFILRVAERAIGLGLFTYDYASRLIYCNYVGVQTAWRGGGMARAFALELCKDAAHLEHGTARYDLRVLSSSSTGSGIEDPLQAQSVF